MGNSFKYTWWIWLAVTLVIAVLATGTMHKYEHARERSIAASHESERSNQHAKQACVGVTEADDLASCLDDNNQTEPQRYYTHYDLKAQQSMARWTRIAAMFTGITAIFAAIGIAFVARNLAATKEIFLAARRPWLAVTLHEPPNESIGWLDDEIRLSFYLKIENTGQIPASGVEIKTIDDPGYNGKNIATEITSNRYKRPWFGGQIAFPSTPISKRTFPTILRNESGDEYISARIGGYAAYSFEGSNERHFTPFLFEVSGWVRDRTWKLSHISEENLDVSPT